MRLWTDDQLLITLHASHPYKEGVKPLSDALTLNGHLKKSNPCREVLTIDNQGLGDASRDENYGSCEALNDRPNASRGL